MASRRQDTLVRGPTAEFSMALYSTTVCRPDSPSCTISSASAVFSCAPSPLNRCARRIASLLRSHRWGRLSPTTTTFVALSQAGAPSPSETGHDRPDTRQPLWPCGRLLARVATQEVDDCWQTRDRRLKPSSLPIDDCSLVDPNPACHFTLAQIRDQARRLRT